MKTTKTLLKGAIVLLLALAMTMSTTAVATKTTLTTSHSGSGIYLAPSPMSTRDDWLHFDDGSNQNSIGLTAGGTFESAIRLTPDELGPYANHVIDLVHVHYGYPDGNSGPALACAVKIYDQGTSTTPGAVLYMQNFTSPTVYSWFNVTLGSPVRIAGDKEMWVSIQWTHSAGTYPGGVDAGPAVATKGDWVWDAADGWIELHNVGLNDNWNLWAHVGLGDTTPPQTALTLDGTLAGGVYITDVKATLTATDDASGVAVTKYQLDGGGWTNYAGPFWVKTDGNHTLGYYSIDNAGNEELQQNATFKIFHAIQIEIKGGFGITVTIKNTAAVAVNTTWKISVDQCICWIGARKSSPAPITIAAGGEKKIHDFVLGFGSPRITVTALQTSKTVTGKLFLFFVSGI